MKLGMEQKGEVSEERELAAKSPKPKRSGTWGENFGSCVSAAESFPVGNNPDVCHRC